MYRMIRSSSGVLLNSFLHLRLSVLAYLVLLIRAYTYLINLWRCEQSGSTLSLLSYHMYMTVGARVLFHFVEILSIDTCVYGQLPMPGHAVHTVRSSLACVALQGKSKPAQKNDRRTRTAHQLLAKTIRILPSIHSLIPERASYHASVDA
jgi:hypothetical protein